MSNLEKKKHVCDALWVGKPIHIHLPNHHHICKVLAQSPHLSAKPLHNSLPQLMHGTVLFFIDSSPFQTTIDSIFYCQRQMHAISLHPFSNISPQEECSLATFPIKVQKPYRERIKTAKTADTYKIPGLETTSDH